MASVSIDRATERVHGPAGLGDGGPLPQGALVLAHERLQRVAARQPDRTAVLAGGEALSYGELDARANALASRLRAEGLGREDVVGICLPLRLDALVAIHGVLRSGAAYLPLDPAQPLERRRYMIEDAGAAALVTTAAWAGDLGFDGPVLTDVRSPAPAERVESDVRPDDLAYVIYTSGSTGKPKGVEIEQRSLAAFVHWGVTAFTPGELESVFAATAFGFDMSLFELTIPFAAGGRLVLADSFMEIADEANRDVTMVNTVPSLMAAALASGVTLPASVRTAVFCGETLPMEVSERVHQQRGVSRVVNAYGPTEDTVYSTAVDVPQGERPTCGFPIPGTQVLILDADLRPVGPEDAGEICLAGSGLARGYRGAEELTRERFVLNPYADDGSARMYRTGDLGRWEPDGSLQHLGRMDHQIKLRGVRIEPAEIEHALVRHPQIRQAAVVARDRPPAGTTLVAYFVCDGAAPEGRTLRAMLRERLPEPMVPSMFVELDQMPLNANGKLDRARLPEPDVAVRGDDELTTTERRLAEMWRDLLGLEAAPGPDDDFFELGGNSLLAFRLFERVEEELHCDLQPSVLLESSTIRSLAGRIHAGYAERSSVVAVNAKGSRPPFLYVNSGAGGILTLRTVTRVLGPHQPLYGIQAFDDDEIATGHIPSVGQRSAELLEIVRGIQPEGPYYIAGHSIGGHIAYKVAASLEAAGERVAYLALLDPAAPHTIRWRGRLTARLRELLGTGPVPRRPGALAAILARLRRALPSRAAGDAVTGEDAEDLRDLATWLGNLKLAEKRFRPPSFSGPTVVYKTVEMTRYTGSPTLGWDRYVRGPLDLRQVPGDHLSMLLEPNVEVLARQLDVDLREAVERAPR